jgi:hypothetical protein
MPVAFAWFRSALVDWRMPRNGRNKDVLPALQDDDR